MKKRILSLVLCAVMLLSMCLFMGAGVTQDAAEAAGEVPQTAVFTEAGPFRPAVSVRPQPLRAAARRSRPRGRRRRSGAEQGSYGKRQRLYRASRSVYDRHGHNDDLDRTV